MLLRHQRPQREAPQPMPSNLQPIDPYAQPRGHSPVPVDHDPFGKPAMGVTPAPQAAARPHMLNFRGRQIEVPNDIRDDELVAILTDGPMPSGPRSGPADRSQPRVLNFGDRIIQIPHDATPVEIAQIYGSDQEPTPTAADISGVPTPPGATRISVTPGGAAAPVDSAPAPNIASAGGQGAWRSMADTAMVLPDLVNMGANAALAGTDWVSRKVGGPELPFRFPLASDSLADTVASGAKKLGVNVFEPDTLPTREKLAYNMSRFGGQAALSAGLMTPLAVARNAGAASKLPQVGDALLAPYVNAPVKTGIGDTAAGIGGGAALTAAQSLPAEVRENMGPIARTMLDLGAMFGGNIGGGGAAGVAMHGPGYAVDRARNFVQPLAREIKRDENGIPTTSRVADKAAEFVQNQSADPARAADTIRRGAEEFRGMDAPIPAVGALSNDPKLLALERGVRREQPGDFAVRDRELRDTAIEKLEGLKPAGADPRAAADRAGELVAAKRGAATEQVRAAEDSLKAAGEGEQSIGAMLRAYGGRGSSASEALDRTVTEQSLRPMQREKNARYDAIDPDRTVMRDVKPLVSLANEIEQSVAEIPAALQREMIPQQLLADIKAMSVEAEGPGRMSFGAMNEMRSGLASASLTARKGGQHTLADNLDKFRTYIGQEGRNLASEGSPAGDRARAANDYYSQDFAPVWNAGPGNAATGFRRDFNADQFNRSLTPPTATANRFLGTGPGAKEKAEALARVVETVPGDKFAALSSIRTYVLDDMSRTITRDGKIDPQQLARWLNGPSGWGDALSQFPSVRTEVEHMLADVRAGRVRSNDAAMAVERAAAGLKRTEAEIGNSALSLVIGREPTKAARSVLESRDPQMAMREVKAELGGNRAATLGWERAVTDHLVDRVTNVDPAGVTSGERAINYGKLVRNLDRYDASLGELYAGQPEKMQALRQMRRILEPLAKQTGPSTTTHSLSAANEAFWKPVEIAMKGIYGVLKGGGMIRTLKVASSFMSDDAQQTQRLVARMMLDPELAQHLLTRPVAEVNTPAWNERAAKLLRRVEAGRELLGDDEE